VKHDIGASAIFIDFFAALIRRIGMILLKSMLHKRKIEPVLIIDFHGTLCPDKFWKSLNPGQTELIDDLLFKKNSGMVQEWMTGQITSEEINQFVAGKLDVDYDQLWKSFVADCENMTVAPVVLEKIKVLGARYTTILFTDNTDSFVRFTVPALRLNEHFDRIIDSYTRKCPKDQLLSVICDEQDADITRSILVDDSAKTCQAFHELGGTSCLVTKGEPQDYWLSRIIAQVLCF
jgi:FMN phosphatase YigB (HAD superfamily)